MLQSAIAEMAHIPLLRFLYENTIALSETRFELFQSSAELKAFTLFFFSL